MAWALRSSHFWHFPSFARGQYPRTAPARKIRNLSHFLEVLQRVEICNCTFSTRCGRTLFVLFFMFQSTWFYAKIMKVKKSQKIFKKVLDFLWPLCYYHNRRSKKVKDKHGLMRNKECVKCQACGQTKRKWLENEAEWCDSRYDSEYVWW